jgi:prepilin-type N-terminal cleavage/methylation domain-containing protein
MLGLMMKQIHYPRMIASGVTMVELIVTISIIAILATLATPNIQDVLRNNRVTSQNNRADRDHQPGPKRGDPPKSGFAG